MKKKLAGTISVILVVMLLSGCQNIKKLLLNDSDDFQAIDSLEFNGADESEELQKLLNEHAGETIIFPENKALKISKTIKVPTGTTLKGGTTFSSIGSITMFQIESNVKIEGLSFQGKKDFNYDEIAISIVGQVESEEARYIQNIEIKDCTFNGIGGMCINAKRVKDMIVQNCVMLNSGYAGVHVFSGDNVAVLNSTIDGILTGGSKKLGYNVTFSNNITETVSENPPSINCRVVNCVIKNNPWEGLDTHGGKNISFLNNQIENCSRGVAVVSVGLDSPIPNYPEAGSDNCTVSGNKIVGNGLSEGISIAGVSNSDDLVKFTRNIDVTNNTLQDCGTADNNTDGSIRVRDTEEINISDNQIMNSKTHGINIYTNVKQFTINNNLIENPNSSSLASISGIIFPEDSVVPYQSIGSIQNNQFIKSDADINVYVGARAIFVNGANHEVTVSSNESTFDAYEYGK